MGLLKEAVRLVGDDEDLPLKYRNHSLSGDYSGQRECHIKLNLTAGL